MPCCGHRGCILASMVAFLECSACVRGAAHDTGRCSRMPCRYLAQEQAEPTSFIEYLGGEMPAAHLVEVWKESGSAHGVVEWLMTTVKCDPSVSSLC
jgi:hypothetical protein